MQASLYSAALIVGPTVSEKNVYLAATILPLIFAQLGWCSMALAPKN
jgi:hypothetical protein